MNSSYYPMLHKAIKFAVKAHQNQDRVKQISMPYILHPIETLNYVHNIAEVTDEEILCATILHDTLEKSNFTQNDILKKFGSRVCKIVLELTRQEPNPNSLINMSKNEIWQIRNELLLKEIQNKMGFEAKLIKLADRLANLRFAPYKHNGFKLVRYTKQTLSILELIPRTISPKLWDTLMDELYDLTIKLPNFKA